jgi:DNA-binding NtrC family response regulator
MNKITKEQFDELKNICEQITILKRKRIKKYGRNWASKMQNFDRLSRHKNIVSKDKINSYLRKIDETMALKNYNISKIFSRLGISRNIYYYLKDGYCSLRTEEILDNTNWNKL